MALTELQLPTKSDFYTQLQTTATNMKTLMNSWTNMADFLENMGVSDLDAIGVPAGQVRTDIVNMRIVINEMIDFFEGTSTTQTVVPESVIDVIRRMR